MFFYCSQPSLKYPNLQMVECSSYVLDSIFYTIAFDNLPTGIQWLFNPAISWTVSTLSVMIRPVVTVILSLLYSSWPLHQRDVLETLIRSPETIRACLSMARD